MLNKLFAKIAVSAKPVAAKPVAGKQMSYDEVKEALKKLPTDVLRTKYEQACERGRKEGRVPVTIQAMADLHKEARYVRHGRPHAATWYVDPFRSATAFVNLRDQCVSMPRPKSRSPNAPKKVVRWHFDVIERTPSPEFLAKAGRKAHS